MSKYARLPLARRVGSEFVVTTPENADVADSERTRAPGSRHSESGTPSPTRHEP